MKFLLEQIQSRINDWGIARPFELVPGLLVILLIGVARLAGFMQPAEKMALDYLLRSRPDEPLDEHILIIGIDEQDIQYVGTYPIPDQTLADLLTTLQQSSPTVIGLDLFRDFSGGDRPSALAEVLADSPNIIGIERAAFRSGDDAVAPPRTLPLEQIGFVNALPDVDGYVRRSLLGATDITNSFKLSFTIRVAEAYLAERGLMLDNGVQDPAAMRFGSLEIPRFRPNTGSYVRADAGGMQTLLNFRSGAQPFRIVSLADVEAGRVPEEWIRDRIVLIGVTATSAGDFINSAATRSSNPGLNSGIEIQAHAISQIVNGALSDRPLLRSWGEGGEYLWIVGWGLAGIAAGLCVASSLRILISTILGGLILLGACYGAIILGWWIPLVPPLLVFALNGTTLAISRFYQYEQSLKTRLHERQLTIEQTFDALHNGPLQTIARMLRQSRERGEDALLDDLEALNHELRSVYEAIRREAVEPESAFYVNSQLNLDLNHPLHEVLYEIYSYTLTRDFPNLASIKLKVVTFESMDSQALTVAQKRGLCRFLEEALCNVGKHAKGVTRLTVICASNQQQNWIIVRDNGMGLGMDKDISSSGGRGTQQAKDLARQLRGTYKRYEQPSGGVSCELYWPVRRSFFSKIRRY